MSDTLNLVNSIWPNGIKVDSDGYAVFYPLGTNKVQVPTSSSEWPNGTKLVSPFVYQDNKLVGFCDTKALTVSGNTTIYLPYTHIEAEFSAIDKGQLQIHAPNATTKKASWKNGEKEDIPEVQFKYKGCTTVENVKAVDSNFITADIVNGVWSEPLWDLVQGGSMFYWCNNLTIFSSDLPSLTNGEGMFENCDNLTSFSSDLSSLTNGSRMFFSCFKLTTINSDLSSLTNGNAMFNSCTNLSIISSDLSSLTEGDSMFAGCLRLTTFNSDLSSLTNGNAMFNNCTNLSIISSNLSSLTNGTNMFAGCSKLESFSLDLSSLTNCYCMFAGCSMLTSFSSNLSSLTNGSGMFHSCKLDTASVQNIADTIKDVTSVEDENYCCSQNKTIDISIGNYEPNEQEVAAFHKMADKGWTVYVNSRQSVWAPAPAAITTLDENGEEITTPIPFWAKPVQTDEEHAKYIDSEGNFFSILGGQFIYGDDISTYGMFTCEEDAAAQMRLTPYIKPIERN